MNGKILVRIFMIAAIFCALFSFLTTFVKAADGSAGATIDKTQGTLDDQFVVTLTIHGRIKGEVAPPVVDGCEVINSGVSHNMQWINGSFSSEDQYTFVLVPGREGTFTVPSWKLNVSGEEVTTLPLSFIVKGGAGAGSGGGSRGLPPPATSGGGDSQAAVGDDIYIEREVPSRAPYVGEAFVSTLRVFHKIQITSATPKRESSPDFRMLSVPGDKTYQRVINGVRWQVIEFKEVLIPLRVGKHSLPPYRLQANVMRANRRLPGGSVFDFFSNRFFGGGGGSLHNFFGREEAVEVKGKAVDVEVKPLPSGSPSDFEGLVGRFKLSVVPTERQVQAGDSLTVNIRVEGIGSLDTLDKVGDSLRQFGKIYPDKPVLKEEFKPSANGTLELYSTKEFKLALVPAQSEGPLALGSLNLTVFDPVDSKYETLSANLGTVEVLPANGANKSAGGSDVKASDAPEAISKESKVSQDISERRKVPLAVVTILLAAAGVGLAAMAWTRKRRLRKSVGAEPAGSSDRMPADFIDEDGEGTIETLEPLASSLGDSLSPAEAISTSNRYFDEALRQAQAGMAEQSLVSVERGAREILAAESGRRVDAMTPREIRNLRLESERALITLAALEQVESAIFSGRRVEVDFIQNIVARIRIKKL